MLGARRRYPLDLFVFATALAALGTQSALGQVVGPVAPVVEKIQFAYDGGDAYRMESNVTNSPLRLPEWDRRRAATDNEPALYKKGMPARIQASFSTPVPGSLTSAEIWATGTFGGTDPVVVSFSAATGKSDPEFYTFEVAEPLPAFIDPVAVT